MQRNLSSLFLQYARLDRKRGVEGLSALEEQIWTNLSRYLAQRLSPHLPPGSDRRASIRVATDLPCTYGGLPQAREAAVTDLSRSGVFIRTDEPLPVGSELWLRIDDGRKGRIEVSAVVATNIDVPGKRGMGVRFAPMGPDAMKAIDDLYQSSIVRRFGAPCGDESGADDGRLWEDAG